MGKWELDKEVGDWELIAFNKNGLTRIFSVWENEGRRIINGRESSLLGTSNEGRINLDITDMGDAWQEGIIALLTLRGHTFE